MKKDILVGDLVEVHLNVEQDAFFGEVLALNDTMCWKDDVWYKVKPIKEGTMPGNFWYRENKVKKANKKT
jgi:hypothetical protein